MATATIGSTIQTGVRAVVGGEGRWSKAAKNAVIHLERYLASHAEAELEGFHSPAGARAGSGRGCRPLRTWRSAAIGRCLAA